MKKWAHVLVTVVGVAAGVATPGTQVFMGHHHIITLVSMAGWSILGGLLPPPIDWLCKLVK
jgi:hypothetical protein